MQIVPRTLIVRCLSDVLHGIPESKLTCNGSVCLYSTVPAFFVHTIITKLKVVIVYKCMC